MSIYAIGDTHFDFTNKKPMGIFGEKWIDHDKKIIDNWKQTVKEEDLVLIPGDISWALKLKEAYNDLNIIDKLPGKKVLIKGNHDYWWETKAKLKALDLQTIEFIQNDCFIYNNIAIFGTRGWLSKDSDEFKQKDIKIYSRELNRLELSLSSLKDKDVDKKIVMIHYPPFNIDSTPNEFVDVMKKYGVDICLYGHLHSEGHKYVTEGIIKDIDFQCVSSDFIDFKLKKII
ncbi:metallophosphoesterase [Abyssisolibacter fermentans]|uniref:metallophosphoesterase n=1 Tax=Abyssisolibacter fermentans TaxID=1766203 RepID=UPI0008348D3E|nr:metallophosphoesterase [Abyssisolibacter fermentans]